MKDVDDRDRDIWLLDYESKILYLQVFYDIDPCGYHFIWCKRSTLELKIWNNFF